MWSSFLSQKSAGRLTVPADPSVQHVRPDTGRLVSMPRKPTWEAYFLRRGLNTEHLPEKVIIIFRRCRNQTFEDDKPRWTRESQPRYVLRRPGCQVCHAKNTNWVPKDDSMPWVDQSKLSHKWKSLMKQPEFEASDVLKNPDWYFPTPGRTKN